MQNYLKLKAKQPNPTSTEQKNNALVSELLKWNIHIHKKYKSLQESEAKQHFQKNLRLVESRHFPAFFSFVSIDPESAIRFHIVCHRRNSIGFRAHKNNRKQITFVSSSVLFGTGFYFFHFRYFIIVLGFHTRDKKMKNRSQFTTNSSKIKFLITRKHIHTHNKKGRLTHTHTQENKRQHQQNESILRARNKMVLFFSF